MKIKYFDDQAVLREVEIENNKTHSFYGHSFSPDIHGYNFRALGEGDIVDGLMRIKTEDEIRMLEGNIIKSPLPRQKNSYIQGVKDEKVKEFVDKYPNATKAEAVAHFESQYQPPEDAKKQIPKRISNCLKN